MNHLYRDIYRRHALALVGALLFTLLYGFGGMLFGDTAWMIELAIAFWCGLILISYWFWSGRSQSFRDSGLTLPYLVWSIMFVTLAIVIVPSVHQMMMMAYLAMLPFGILGLGWRALMGICLLIVGCYSGAVLTLQYSAAGPFESVRELLLGIAFTLAVMSFGIVGREFVLLRDALGRKNRELRLALARIEELSTRDETTGLINRRHFVKTLMDKRAMSRRDGGPFVVALVEIDHFDEVCTEFGEFRVEQMLADVAQLMLVIVREVDEVACFGRDKFALMLSGAQLIAGEQVVERIRKRIAEQPMAEGMISITISAGVVQYQPSESVDALLHRTDALVVEARKQGRNQVVSQGLTAFD
ncbi:GGDEF domain-containing protein [Oceanobacter antarcticus]|uniref:diguanylate cyclase n=1 Tax=Oceanobacter antarcticus TaxID=3133425 RepID=A0ABW8NLZ9_9GAMM